MLKKVVTNNLYLSPETILEFQQIIQKENNITLSFELDALPPNALVQKIEASIQVYLDLSKFQEQIQLRKLEQERIETVVEGIGGRG